MKCLKSFLPKEILLDTTILLTLILSIKNDTYIGGICIFQFQYHQTL